jgi:hypothetical protein
LSQSRKYLRTPSDSKDVFLFVGLCPICKRVLTPNGDADPLSRINPATKQMFHDAIKAVCSACVISASNPCIETVLLTQNVNIDESLVSDVDSLP